jgi:hypothetical protein
VLLVKTIAENYRQKKCGYVDDEARENKGQNHTCMMERSK